MNLPEQIVATVREPLLVLEQNLFVKTANQAFFKMFHVSEAEIAGRSIFDLCTHQWDLPELRKLLTDLSSNKTAFETFEIIHNFSNLTTKTFCLNAREIKNDGASTGLILLAFDDITSRREIEGAFKLILNASQMGMLQSKKSGEIVFVNKEVQNIFGYDENELIGKNVNILLPERFRASHTVHMQEFWKAPKIRPMAAGRNLVGLTKCGTEVPLEISLVPVMIEGESYMVQGMFDVSFRRAAVADQHAREIAEEASKAKSKFLASMSHEMRTPLSAIVGFSELLEQDVTQAVDFVEVIRRNAKHLSSLIDDILDLSKVEAGQMSLDSVVTNLREEVDGAILMLSNRAKAKGLAIHCTYNGILPKTILTDPMRLRQILINVIGNAIKFTEVGSIDVSVKMDETKIGDASRYVAFSITDSGLGIERSKHLQIFEPFCQEATTTARRFGGTGIGLTLSRQLARLMGGDLVLKYSEPGKGSTFEFSITSGPLGSDKDPPIEPSRCDPSSNKNAEKALHGLHILLVEDSPDNRLLLEKFLESDGAKVDLATDGIEGVNMALKGTYDVIIMDVQMPNLDGRQATEQLRKAGYKLPIIALTADATKEEKNRCLASGMNDYCTKPISNIDLCKIISKWAGR